MSKTLDFKTWLEAIGTGPWDEEKMAKQQSAINQQDRQMILNMLTQVATKLNQGEIYNTANEVKKIAGRLQQTLKASEVQKMPQGLHPAQVLEQVAQQLAQKETQFNNLSSKQQVKKAVAEQAFAIQQVMQWLGQLQLWQPPLANQNQYPVV